jgi:hypothetical protein
MTNDRNSALAEGVSALARKIMNFLNGLAFKTAAFHNPPRNPWRPICNGRSCPSGTSLSLTRAWKRSCHFMRRTRHPSKRVASLTKRVAILIAGLQLLGSRRRLALLRVSLDFLVEDHGRS